MLTHTSATRSLALPGGTTSLVLVWHFTVAQGGLLPLKGTDIKTARSSFLIQLILLLGSASIKAKCKSIVNVQLEVMLE